VNGVLAYDGGTTTTGRRAGRVLRRP